MARTVSGIGASIEPVFNEFLGIEDIIILDGGEGYDPLDPPKLTIQNAGTPDKAAILRPNINENGEIESVDIIDPGFGYDPLRLVINNPNIDNTNKAVGEIILNSDGTIHSIEMTRFGDGYYDYVGSEITTTIEGGGGSGAVISPILGNVTGLTVTRPGKNYKQNNIRIEIVNGGGTSTYGNVTVNEFGIINNIEITNPGRFFKIPPLIRFDGGNGSGASALASISGGSISNVEIISPGNNYITNPSIQFNYGLSLTRNNRNRISYNFSLFQITGLTTNATKTDTTLNVETTLGFPDFGSFIINNEIIRYSSKTNITFDNCYRGVNHRYDQRVVLDNTYNFYTFDSINKAVSTDPFDPIPTVYDWDPTTNELFITFEPNELTFIYGGNAFTDVNTVRFNGGTADSSSSTQIPGTVINNVPGSNIVLFEEPLRILANSAFQDTDMDGFPDVDNTGTSYENSINLHGGNADSLYTVSDFIADDDTILLQVGDQIEDSSSTPKTATIIEADQIVSGLNHTSTATIYLREWNGTAFVTGQTVTGNTSGVTGIVISYESKGFNNITLMLENLNHNGNNYKFEVQETITSQNNANGIVVSQTFNTLIRNEFE